MSYRLRPTPDLPHTCAYCDIPSAKPYHYRCNKVVAERWRYALSREQREFGRDVGKALAEALCL